MSDHTIDREKPSQLFHELVRSAMQAQRLTPPTEAEFYLVNLLERFVRAPVEWLDRPLAISYLEAAASSDSERAERFRGVGDTALFVAGLFFDSLERSLVSPAYYAELGQLAYHNVAQSGARQVRSLFAQLAQHFDDLLRILVEVSGGSLFTTDQDTIRIYRRWAVTQSAPDAARLIRRGIIPTPIPVSRHRH